MNKKLLLPLVPLLLLGIFLGIPTVVPPAHAAGTVCFNDPASFSTSAPCAPAGTALNGPAPTAALTNAIPAGNIRGPNQIRLGVYLSGPDLINGFDVTVLADRAVLRPAAVDLSGTVLASPTSIVVECLDGALVTGPTCLSTDVPGTMHFSVSGAPGVLSTGSTGLLFTAIYNITGSTSASGSLVKFQTGCGSPTSPTSDPPICVTITNGGSGPVSESVGTIGFNNSVDPNWVAISTPSPPTYSFNVGAASPTASISATAENGYPGLVGTDLVSFTSIQSSGLTVSFTGAVTSCSTLGATCSVSVSFGGVAGTYFVTFFGNYVYSNDTTLSPDGTLDGTVSLVVNIQDVSWTINGVAEYPGPQAQTLYMGTGPTHPMPLFFSIQSIGGYSGTITYSTQTATGTTGLVFAYPAAFTLGAGQTITKTINGTATTTGTASYVAHLVVSGFTATHNSAVQTVKVSGFTLISNSTSVTFAPSGSKHIQLTSTSLGNPPATNGFAGSVALTAPFTGPAGGVLTFTFTPAASITLTASGTGSVNVAISGTVSGTYTVTFTGTGGTNNGMTNSTAVTVIISGGQNSPTIATTLSATSIVVGTTVTDSSTLTGATATAGGTVSYLLFLNGACTAPSSTVSVVTVTNAVVPNSRAVVFNATGSYSFQASYSGDTGNKAAPSPCEPLTVTKASPTIATTLSTTTPVVGTTVTDSATLSSFFQAGGTVQYNVYPNGACTAPFTIASVVAVLNGVVPNSRAVLFNSTGAFAFQAVYSGDANNNVATSACEPLTVNKASPTITTSLSASSITVGASVTDSSTMASFFQAGGSVTYNEFGGSTCAGTATVVSTVTVTNGVVPTSTAVTPTPAGSFSFNAAYSGDNNNNAVTSTCELLTVNKASPTIATTLSSNSVRVGQTITDSATLSNFFQAGGLVTYSVFSNGACTAPGTVASIVTVTNGVVSNSRAVLFNATGSFSFHGVYSGDANNNGATSQCEPLTVAVGVAISTTLSSTTPVVGTTGTDSATLSGQTATAGGTVTYSLFANSACTSPGGTISIVTVSNGVVPDSRAVLFNSTGSFGFVAAYSGDANNNAATSPCEALNVQKASPTITTILSAATITVGSSATDSSTLTSSFQAGGTVTYGFFSGSTCGGTATIVGAPVTVANGVVPNSASQPFNSAGLFSWNAIYSGDTNNNLATSACEPLTVQKASPTIATSLSSTTPTVGTTVTDSATLTNGFSAGGSVTYSVFANGSCTAPGAVVSVVTVSTGVVGDSRAVTFNSTGSFAFLAVYSGDTNNNGATSPCEPLTVQKASPTIATSVSSNAISVGQSVTDSATLAGAFQAGGTVTYSVFSNGVCTAPGTAASTVGVTNGVVPDSRAVIFNSTGSFSFLAVYSGDAKNNGSSSPCEPLTVSAGVAISTTLSSTSPIVGTTVTDAAALSGQTATAGGTVTYTIFISSGCTSTGTVVSIVTVTNGVVPDSRAVLFNATGGFSFTASYSGDANNNAAASPCESLTVVKASPTITTALSASTITVGSSVTDSSILANFFQAGGTVTYEFFAGSTCSGTATTVGTPVTVTNGVVPDSASQMFNTLGSFSWNAVYSGDVNNNGATSPCEPLTVANQRSLTTTLSQTTIIVGNSVTDSASLFGTTTGAGGTVAFTDFANNACASPGSIVSVVTVTNAVVPVSRAVIFNSTGDFSFQASYSGDANNAPLTSACEVLTVNKASPTIATTLSSNSILVGESVTDSSTLSSFFQAGGTVTYSVFSNGSCNAPGTVASMATVANGVVPSSRAVTFNATGNFSFQAVYSGDVNNNGATSPCEPLTVGGVLTITTTLSTATITVGGSVTDSAVLSGQTATAGGTVTYLDFATATCSAPGTIVSIVTVTNGVVPSNRAVTFNSTGSFSFQASYGGDTGNPAATSTCEPLTVNMASPILETLLSSTSISVGDVVTDSATLSGSFQAGGTVVYSVFSNNVCTAPGNIISTVDVIGGSVPNSRAVTFNSTGNFGFQASYSGDANNNGAISSCEPLSVGAPVSIQTTLSAVTITVGGSVSDSATLSGQSATAGGTVTYTDFANGICESQSTVVSVVTVSNGVVPDSRAVTFNTTGSFSFQAAYSGDANNNAAISSCETLTVSKASPTISTALSATSITVGGSVTDSATLSGATSTAGGTVTYYVFASGGCVEAGTIVSVVTVTNGLVPVSRAVTFNSTGNFSFNAVYSGDANNNGAPSACEPITVASAGKAVLLTFSAFDADDFTNGVGQLQVFVNGHLVVDIPAGLNHLTGSGDYEPYNLTWIQFGPFDISGFVVQGQNNLTFKDPLNSHLALVKNVMIVQGDQVLLKVTRAAAVFHGRSVTYTFSIPPLVITSFTVTSLNPRVEQNVTFTATFTGGTAPFTCLFRFGDGEFAFARAVGGSCSVTHDYDDSGRFSAVVTIKGASTSDLVSARMTITVTSH